MIQVPLAERMHHAFIRCWNWGYSANDPQVPEWLPGMPEALKAKVASKIKPGMTNCTVLKGWLIFAAIPRARTVNGLWLDLQVGRGPDRPWSPQEGLVAAGLGTMVDAEALAAGDLEPGEYSTQSWSALSPTEKVVKPDAAAGIEGSRGHARWLTVGADKSWRVREASMSKRGVVDSYTDVKALAKWGKETRMAKLAER